MPMIDPTEFQREMHLPQTGVWDIETLRTWNDLRWKWDGWEQADWVKPNNWEWIHNEMVSEEP